MAAAHAGAAQVVRARHGAGPQLSRMLLVQSEESHFAGGVVLNVAEDSRDSPMTSTSSTNLPPGWTGNDPTLRMHVPCVRGCWPKVHGIES